MPAKREQCHGKLLYYYRAFDTLLTLFMQGSYLYLQHSLADFTSVFSLLYKLCTTNTKKVKSLKYFKPVSIDQLTKI